MAEVKIREKSDESEALSALRHTASHVLAYAVKRMWPEAQLAIGPSIAEGFYYDFDLEHRFSDEDLAVIEKEMKNIVKAGYSLEQFDHTRADALKWADENGEQYKRELIEDLEEELDFSFYKMGEFVDLCKGPISTARARSRRLSCFP